MKSSAEVGPAALDDQFSASGHGVPGVGRQVDQHLLDLADVGLDRRVSAADDPHLDVLADEPLQQFFDAFQDRFELHVLEAHHLLPAERQQALRQVGGPLGGREDIVHVRPQGVVLGELHLKQAPVPGDGRQDIVEVVGHAAGQSAHCLHFLRMAQLFLERPFLRYVVVDLDGGNDPPEGVLERERFDLDEDDLPVAVVVLVDGGIRLARLEGALDRALLALLVAGMGAVVRHVVAVPAHDLGKGSVSASCNRPCSPT